MSNVFRARLHRNLFHFSFVVHYTNVLRAYYINYRFDRFHFSGSNNISAGGEKNNNEHFSSNDHMLLVMLVLSIVGDRFMLWIHAIDSCSEFQHERGKMMMVMIKEEEEDSFDDYYRQAAYELVREAI